MRLTLPKFRRSTPPPAVDGDQQPMWDSTVGAGLPGTDDGRYMRIGRIDAWRSTSFDVPPPPDRADYRLRVRQLVEGLGPAAVDEGSGAALDPTIEAWVASWIATVDTAFVDHASVIDVHHGQAAEWLVETEKELAFAQTELAEATADHAAARDRLRGVPETPASATTTASTTDEQEN